MQGEDEDEEYQEEEEEEIYMQEILSEKKNLKTKLGGLPNQAKSEAVSHKGKGKKDQENNIKDSLGIEALKKLLLGMDIRPEPKPQSAKDHDVEEDEEEEEFTLQDLKQMLGMIQKKLPTKNHKSSREQRDLKRSHVDEKPKTKVAENKKVVEAQIAAKNLQSLNNQIKPVYYKFYNGYYPILSSEIEQRGQN